MALGRKDVTVTRTNGGADIFRLAGLFGDDNLICHQWLVWWTDDASALADETFPLAAGSLRVLLRQRRDRRHSAMIWLAPQPAEKGALEQLGVQAIGLRPPVLA